MTWIGTAIRALKLMLPLLGVPTGAHAERHVVQRGETIAHVARVHGCTTASVLRANRLQTTLVRPGTVVAIPACRSQSRPLVAASTAARNSPRSDADKARLALAAIDGHDAAGPRPSTRIATGHSTSDEAARRWIGQPSFDGARGDRTTAAAAQNAIDGATWMAPDLRPRSERLDRGKQLQAGHDWAGRGYQVRRPQRAYGAGYVVDHIRRAIAEVRALYPDVHTLAIGDLSAERGGKISDHLSHRAGLDVDIGFYFKQMPSGYPAQLADANANLDLQATWALLTAFARTAPLASGVSIMFLDYAIQRRLVEWARARGTPERDLAFLFQYPRGADSQVGLVRHWPNHANHVHVRFKAGK